MRNRLPKLFHLSDDPAIVRFEPRASDYTESAVVWAIEESRLVNYLLPRECPRVCLRAGSQSAASDVAHFLGTDAVVIAIERAWLARLQAARLHCYTMPAACFTLHDASAGYWVADQAVTPLGVETLSDLPAAIAAHGATLRVLPSLWTLRDAVVGSSLVVSIIRLRNAAPQK